MESTPAEGVDADLVVLLGELIWNREQGFSWLRPTCQRALDWPHWRTTVAFVLV